MQSKAHSVLESISNIAIGSGAALASQLVVFPLYGINVPLQTNIGIMLWFTLISFVRSYVIRRWFTKKTEADSNPFVKLPRRDENGPRESDVPEILRRLSPAEFNKVTRPFMVEALRLSGESIEPKPPYNPATDYALLTANGDQNIFDVETMADFLGVRSVRIDGREVTAIFVVVELPLLPGKGFVKFNNYKGEKAKFVGDFIRIQKAKGVIEVELMSGVIITTPDGDL